MSRKRLHSRMLGLLLSAAAIALPATPASAGTYNIYSCTNSATHSAEGWVGYEVTAGEFGGSPYFYNQTDCASGFYRRFESDTVPGGATSALTFVAPADTYLASATLYQDVVPRSTGAYDAVYAELEDGTRRLIGNYVASPTARIREATYTMPTTGPRATRMRTELGCQSTVSSCSGMSGTDYGNVWGLGGATIQVVDPVDPAFTSVTGAGWSSQPADGVLPVDVSAGDKGSGISRVHFLVDGIEHDVRTVACVPGDYQPCPTSADGHFSLDTTQLSEGAHSVSLVADDQSGNTFAKSLSITVRRPPHASATSPVTTTDPSANGGGSPTVGDTLTGNGGSWVGDGITYTYQWFRCDALGVGCSAIDGATGLGYTATTDDIGHTLQFCVTATNSGGAATSCSAPTPAVVASHSSPVGGSTGTNTTSHASVVDRGAPNGSPASERVVLTAIANSRSSVQKVKFGKRVPITGRLVGANGSPIAGAVLAVQVQTAVPGASMADAAQVVTGSDGRFKYLAPGGPSRVIRFGYRAYTADTSFADTTDVRLLVSAGVTMKATPKKVHNKHATVFKGRLLGKPVAKRGVVVDLQVFFRKQWRTFAAPRTNKAGVYKFKYRFMAGAAKWKFRARVRKDSSYPYELGYTAKPIKVKVVR